MQIIKFVMEVKNKKKQSRQRSMLTMEDLPVFSTVGIISSSPLHKIAWQLNETFSWNLEVNVELTDFLQLPSHALVYVGKDKKSNNVLLLPPFLKSSKVKKSAKNKLIFDFILIYTNKKNDEISEYLTVMKSLSIFQFVSIYPDNVPFTDDWLVVI